MHNLMNVVLFYEFVTPKIKERKAVPARMKFLVPLAQMSVRFLIGKLLKTSHI